MITSRPLTALMGLTIAAGLAASAHGQGACNLPDAVVSARNPTDVDAAAIRACVDANSAGLRGDYDAIRAARQSLLTPLRGTGVSVFFRLSYSEALRPVLQPLVREQNEDIALNAIRIAGELGTVDGAQMCIAALADTRPAVRMMAASGLARTFGVLATTPTIPAERFGSLESAIGAALTKETDPRVLDGFAMIYESAVQIPSNVVPEAQNTALRSLATQFGRLIRGKSVDGAMIAAQLRASNAVFNTLNSLGLGVKPPEETLRETGGFGGDLLAYALRRVNTGEVEEAERQQLAVLVGQAQNLISRSHTLLGGTGKAYQLDKLVREGNDQQYKRDVMNVIGSEGDLAKPPFNHKKERFLSP